VKKPTISNVAERAGVAVSTVSRYLNGHYVSKSAKARIGDVILELGYSPSANARNLSLGRKGCVGLAVDSSLYLWFTQILAGIEEELSRRDTSLMLASLELEGRYDPHIVHNWIKQRRIDGLIIANSHRRERPLFQAAIEAQLPTVLVSPDETSPHVHVVRSDNRGGGVAVAHHLANLGHKRVAFAGGPVHSVDSKHRLNGLRDGLEERGLHLDPKHVAFCDDYTPEAGAAYATQFLKKPSDVTAIVFGNDGLALGFMRVALQRGLRIPHDISVVGFDNVPEGAFVWPGLTTVAQPLREMGRNACRRLFEAIENPTGQQVVVFPLELVIRESTAPPPSA